MDYEIVYRIFMTDEQMSRYINLVKENYIGELHGVDLTKILEDEIRDLDTFNNMFCDVKVEIFKKEK